MEPQLFSCGLVDDSVYQWDTLMSFNGAATFQLRIDDFSGRSSPRTWASMEPQLFSCGLSICILWIIWYAIMLQWSRNFSVADCHLSFLNETRDEYASMEPQLFSCGLMEIRPKRVYSLHCFNGAATFQLRIVVKHKKEYFRLCQLQWSRNFSVADCGIELKMGDALYSASMEPQLFSCGLQNNP